MTTTQTTQTTQAGENIPRPVHLNRARARDLAPIFGPVIAQRIIDLRDQRGPFRTTAGLLDVRGISEAVYLAKMNRVTVADAPAAYVVDCHVGASSELLVCLACADRTRPANDHAWHYMPVTAAEVADFQREHGPTVCDLCGKEV